MTERNLAQKRGLVFYVPKFTFSTCYDIKEMSFDQILVPKSETRGFDSWLTSSLRIECNFPLATSDIEMMSETKFYS